MSVKQTKYCAPGQPPMMLYPNQSAVVIHKPNYSQDKIQYLQVGIEEWMEAQRNLKPKSFTLYLYLCSNMDGLQKAFSPADVYNKTKISKKSFYNAVDELMEKGYLIKHEKNGKTLHYNCYEFYTSPELNPEWNQCDANETV